MHFSRSFPTFPEVLQEDDFSRLLKRHKADITEVPFTISIKQDYTPPSPELASAEVVEPNK